MNKKIKIGIATLLLITIVCLMLHNYYDNTSEQDGKVMITPDEKKNGVYIVNEAIIVIEHGKVTQIDSGEWRQIE